MKPEDHRVTVALGEPLEGVSDVPTVILGMPIGAWNFMKDGMTHTFDLTKVGVPVRIILFRGANGGDVRRKLADVNIFLKSGAIDAQGNLRDLGIEEPTKQ